MADPISLAAGAASALSRARRVFPFGDKEQPEKSNQSRHDAEEQVKEGAVIQPRHDPTNFPFRPMIIEPDHESNIASHDEYATNAVPQAKPTISRSRVREWLRKGGSYSYMSDAAHQELNTTDYRNRKAYKYPTMPGEELKNSDTEEQYKEDRKEQRARNYTPSIRAIYETEDLSASKINPDIVSGIPRRRTSLEEPSLLEHNRTKRVAGKQRTHTLFYPMGGLDEEFSNVPPMPRRSYNLFNTVISTQHPYMSEPYFREEPTAQAPTHFCLVPDCNTHRNNPYPDTKTKEALEYAGDITVKQVNTGLANAVDEASTSTTAQSFSFDKIAVGRHERDSLSTDVNVTEALPEGHQLHDDLLTYDQRRTGEFAVVESMALPEDDDARFEGLYQNREKTDTFVLDDESDRASVISEVDSVFSVASLASTATNFSAVRKYTPAQIAAATRELLQIFQEDEFLKSLYQIAIARTDIGPERLQRNVRRLLKTFARNLQSEAERELERLAARLVFIKAAYVAQSIIENFEIKLLRREPHLQNKDDSSDDEDDEDPLDEDLIEDLPAFRQFLVGGGAFASYYQQLSRFVLPEMFLVPTGTAAEKQFSDQVSASIVGETPERIEEEPWERQNHTDLLNEPQGILADLLIATGCLEPPLVAGWTRLRWRCVSS